MPIIKNELFEEERALYGSENITLIGCRFESEVEATLISPVISIKNPYSGRIVLPYAAETVLDDPFARCEIKETEKE